MLKIRWYCGMYVWDGNMSWYDEPPECTFEFETEAEDEEWFDGMCEEQCPKCGGILSQAMGHAIVIGTTNGS